MKIVNVIPLKKGLLKNDLSYFTTKNIGPGSIVSVYVRNTKTLALVVSVENATDTKMNIKGMDFNLKKILEVKGKSIFRKEYIEAIMSTGVYFASSKNSAITSLIPALFRDEYDTIAAYIDTKKIFKNSLSQLKNEKLLLQEDFENRISIYKTLIRENFANKKSVFVVLPTEKDVVDFEEYLSKGIEQFTFTFHGGYSSKKILEKFKNVMNVEHTVLILATTPFLSIPRTDVGVIILEHESSPNYKMIARPHFDLRTFVEIFASNINAKYIISDSLLRFETISRQTTEGLPVMHPLSFRFNFEGEIDIQNPKVLKASTPAVESKAFSFKVFPQKSLREIASSLSKQNNVFVFTLRKGLATQTICSDCGELVSCKNCSSPLVLYMSNRDGKRFFVCNRCGDEKNSDVICSNCDSWNLSPLGIGTETVEQELSTIFPDVKIFRLDRESVKTKKEALKIITEFEETSGAILVGTEMAIHYIKNKVPLSVVASFDSFWSIPNFTISEKVLQIVSGIITKTSQKLIIQTKNDTDPAIKAIQSRNLLLFIRSELKDRARLGYPPFKRFIKIKYSGSKTNTTQAKKIFEEVLAEYKPLIFSGFVSYVKRKYVVNALIKIETKDWSLPELSTNTTIDQKLLTKLRGLPFDFEIFVDPEDLL